jgi:Arc/MetJ-type ribon-helix-helix transcriptional regulator
MQISLTKPEVERFIAEQVKAGHYPSPEAVVEAAITELQDLQAGELDSETVDAINEAEAQADRGEGVELDTFRAEFRKKICGS